MTLPSRPPPTGQVTGGSALKPCYVTARVLSGSAMYRELTPRQADPDTGGLGRLTTAPWGDLAPTLRQDDR